MKEITLTGFEMMNGALVGVRRHVQAILKDMKHKYGYEGNAWTNNIEGACGELAAAKALGVYWSGSVNTFKNEGDVGNLEVRTRSEHRFDMIVRKDDKDEDIVVHVTGQCPTYMVRGWLPAKDAKREEFLQAYGQREPAYFVPEKFLRPIEELKSILHKSHIGE